VLGTDRQSIDAESQAIDGRLRAVAHALLASTATNVVDPNGPPGYGRKTQRRPENLSATASTVDANRTFGAHNGSFDGCVPEGSRQKGTTPE